MSRIDRFVTLALEPLSVFHPPISVPKLSLIDSLLLFFAEQPSPRRPFLSPCLLLLLVSHIFLTRRPCRKRRHSRLGIPLLYPRPRPKNLPYPRVVRWSPTSLQRHRPIIPSQRAPPDPYRDKRVSGLPPPSYDRPRFDSQTLSTTSRESRP
ncbi:hypothetical protein BDV23DRAFT_47214 [Aspergillus alliaceus]|uniref:Uncharacterized protein n=1 Tax=Petromyces alliaceus TaxID=209559 RepID=A0A5N7CQ01_PETAA|nr:hypothetical protein BDV23DRAFT_47214 [Aspergillus alliaceus]